MGLRTISLQGADLADGAGSASWEAGLSLAFMGKGRTDKSLPNSTHGLRVLLQAATPDAAISGTTPNFLSPQLLVAHAHPFNTRSLKIDAGETLTILPDSDRWVQEGVEPQDAERGIGTLLVTPRGNWPLADEAEIVVPPFRLVEGRLRTRLSCDGAATRSLGLRATNAPNAIAAFAPAPNGPGLLIKKVTQPAGSPVPGTFPCIPLELTADGIEFRGRIANPFRGLGGPAEVEVVVRLVHEADPMRPGKGCWSLLLVDEAPLVNEAPPRRALAEGFAQLRQTLGGGGGRPAFIDLDTTHRVPPLRWPLNIGQPLTLRTQPSGDELVWVDADAVSATLLGDPVEGGSLPTTVTLRPTLLELRPGADSLDCVLHAERRVVSPNATPAPPAGPKVTLHWQKPKPETPPPPISFTIDPPATKHTWLLDQATLSEALVTRYRAAGVHPPAATSTYAFLPVRGGDPPQTGWLQWPVAITPATPRNALPIPDLLEGGIDVLDRSPGTAARRLRLTGAARIQILCTRRDDEALAMTVVYEGASGSLDGLLWVAAASPSAEAILPDLAGGPASLFSPALHFCATPLKEGSEERRRFFSLTSEGSYASTGDAPMARWDALPPGSPPALLWMGYGAMPLATAIGLTRTAAASGRPSSIRHLLCRQIDAVVSISLQGRGAAAIGLEKSDRQLQPEELNLFEAELWKQVPLVALTLPGIEFTPAAGRFQTLLTSLRFDLPALDELFAMARLPEKRTIAPAGAPANGTGAAEAATPPVPQPGQDAPTALDPAALRVAWQAAADRLALSRTQARYAIELAAQSTAQHKVTSLFEGATWTAEFSLDATSTLLGLPQPAPFGSYTLAAERHAGEAALAGLSANFTLNADGTVLTKGTAPEGENPLRITGFAADLWQRKAGEHWRDTRGQRIAADVVQQPVAGTAGSLLLREGSANLVTLARPIHVDAPPGNDRRKLGLWFRDLPMTSHTGNLKLDFTAGALENSTGPLQSAFDPGTLPQSIYEWRFCNDADSQDGGPALHDIAVGPFHFRPLRLLDVKLERDAASHPWRVAGATVAGRLSLRTTGAEKLDDALPFGAERHDEAGALVSVSLVPKGEGLGFKGDSWQQRNDLLQPAAEQGVLFRTNQAKLYLGKAKDPVTGDVSLALDLHLAAPAEAGAVPGFSAATLWAVLFGQVVKLTAGTVKTANGLEVVFTSAATGPGNGLRLTQVKVTWSDGACLLRLSGALSIQADNCEVLRHELGSGTIDWLGQSFANPSVRFDHARGVADFGIRSIPDPERPRIEPIAGLFANGGSADATLVLAFGPAAGGFLPSISGAGGLRMSGSEDGPLGRFEHRLVAEDGVWTSKISADIRIVSRPSQIAWPMYDQTKLVLVNEQGRPETSQDLGATLSGRRLTGTLTSTPETTLRHSVNLAIVGLDIPTGLLTATKVTRGVRLRLKAPLHALAVVDHTLTAGDGSALGWRTLDQVAIVDARALIEEAKAVTNPGPDRRFAFAAHYKSTLLSEGGVPESAAPRPGVFLRALAEAGFPARSMAQHLQDLTVKADQSGVILTGAGPSVVRTTDDDGNIHDPKGVVLALPWLIATDAGFGFMDDPAKLTFPQMTTLANGRTWNAPDIDWAAGSPMPLGRWAAPVLAPGDGSDAALRRLIDDAVVRGDASRQLTAVEQLFIRPAQDASDPPQNRPFWLRSLLALSTIWNPRVRERFAERVTQLVPSGNADGRVARFRLTRQSAEIEQPASVAKLYVIGRDRTRSLDVPATEIPPVITALGNARLLARAANLLREPRALLLVQDTGWQPIDGPRDVDADALDVPGGASLPIHASAALGWPTARGTALAGDNAMVMGPDQALQDRSEETDNSGLSGRSASMRLPARASEAGTAAFYALGRKTIFKRPKDAALPLRTPPARYLSPTEARAVLPTHASLDAAIEAAPSCTPKTAPSYAPLVPPHLERTGFGIRPGVLQAEFDALLFADAGTTAKGLDPEEAMFGQPGHAGPRLMRQLRQPRAPGLPRPARDKIETQGRRSFVALDECDADGSPVPLLLFGAPACVLRTRKGSLRIRAADMPLCADIGRSQRLTIKLLIDSPSFKTTEALVAAMREVGLLRQCGVTASLALGPLTTELEALDFTAADGRLRVTFSAQGTPALREALEATDGDRPAIFLWRGATEGTIPTTEPPALGPTIRLEPAGLLQPEPRRLVSLQLPVLPGRRPTLGLGSGTVIFADPSYDRALAGPTASVASRDAAGRQLKLVLDRFEYGVDTPVFLAFGSVLKGGGWETSANKADLRLQWKRAAAPPDAEPETLSLDKLPAQRICFGKPYGFSLDRLFQNGRPVLFEDGDELIVKVTFAPVDLSLRARIVRRPVIAPPPAMYAAILLDDAGTAVRGILHATGPLPDRIEFVDLAGDLAAGLVRRKALFEWPITSLPQFAPERAVLVKLDRAGGGQFPARARDLQAVISS